MALFWKYSATVMKYTANKSFTKKKKKCIHTYLSWLIAEHYLNPCQANIWFLITNVMLDLVFTDIDEYTETQCKKLPPIFSNDRCAINYAKTCDHQQDQKSPRYKDIIHSGVFYSWLIWGVYVCERIVKPCSAFDFNISRHHVPMISLINM